MDCTPSLVDCTPGIVDSAPGLVDSTSGLVDSTPGLVDSTLTVGPAVNHGSAPNVIVMSFCSVSGFDVKQRSRTLKNLVYTRPPWMSIHIATKSR